MHIRFLLIFTALLFAATSAWSNVGMPAVMQEVQSYFTGLDGVVVDADGDMILVDLGSNKKVVEGLQLKAFHGGESIVHPVTGKVLGQRQGNSGVVTITKVFPEYSESQYMGTEAPIAGDHVGLTFPLPVSFAKDSLTADDEEILKNLLTANSVLREGKTEDSYIISIKRLENAVSYAVTQKDGVIILSNTIMSVVAPKGDHELRVEGLSRTAMPKGRYLSIARGQIYKDNKKSFVVGITDDKLTVLDPDNGFMVAEEIKGSFSKILNVEVADLDKDGVDEIFVTHVFKKRSLTSKIYRHNGKEFELAVDDLPWVFRSVRNPDGSRVILVQKISSDGEYTGEIYNFIYKDGKYSEGEVIKGTLGKRLFGFSIMTVPETDEKLFINIGKGARLSLSTFRKVEYNAPDYFGDTFHTLSIGQRARTPSGANPDEKERTATYYETLIYVNPRIEIAGSRYYIAVQNNILTRIFVGSPIFTKSNIGMYSFRKGIVTKEASVEDLDPVIVDVWYYEESGERYVMTLVSKSTWAFQKGESDIVTYQITGKDSDQ